MQLDRKKYYRIAGVENGQRLDSRILEDKIQKAVTKGYRNLEIEALGQHGIGGRLWAAEDEPVHIVVSGPSGQRLGSMGFANTRIDVLGNASEDVGWLNAGAEIVVHGHAGNGVGNAMAQGKVLIAGNIGARGMTMTKRNPRFDPPELWVLGSVGDYFAEFMAGGIAVICGCDPQNNENVLGYRPCVGMVGGRIFLRGSHKGFSEVDAKQIPISEQEWTWLTQNLGHFLHKIDREELFDELSNPDEWQLLEAKRPMEKLTKPRRSLHDFRNKVWDAELGAGGLIGDLSQEDRSPIPLITTGDLRRYIPVWANRQYLPPCEASCPTGIPVQQRWELIREGRVDEAVDLAMTYSPFPATICGYLCPNVCMQSCTRQIQNLRPVDISKLGRATLEAELPQLPPLSGRRVAVIGGGPAGVSVAWQLRQKGHEAVIFERSKRLGGKIREVIPRSRIPDKVLDQELKKMEQVLDKVHLQQPLSQKDIEQLEADYDFVVLAVGAQQPRILNIPGKEKMISALDFLRQSLRDDIQVGKRMVIIGAGNVGCDVATEAHRLGAEDITLIDIQQPASFGKERRDAEAVGAKFRWPVFVQEISEEGVILRSGELLPADSVVIATGDQPESSFLPDTVETEAGFIQVDENYRSSDPNIFAVGDAVRPGLITDAVGSGRKVALAIDDLLQGRSPDREKPEMIQHSRMTLEYFDPRYMDSEDLEQCAEECVSCGSCRDCGICIQICPVMAISKRELDQDDFELVVDPDRCIGCGFCAAACPCGIWEMAENFPLA